jgi:Ca2+-binding EF-hand superfamily protein
MFLCSLERTRARNTATATSGADLVGVSNELLQELVQAFSFIADPSGQGDVTTIKLTEERLDRMIKSVGLDKKTSAKDMLRDASAGGREIDFVAFRDMMIARMKQSDSEDNIRSNFQKFETAKGSAKCNGKELKLALTKMGRTPLRQGELDEFLRIPGVDEDGLIYYEKFMQEFFGEKSKQSPE